MHETYSLHKDGGSAYKLWKFHKNWRSSAMPVKDDRTKLLLKLLIPWSSSLKAVSVYLKQKLKEQFVMFLRKSCLVLAVGVLEITTIFKRDGNNKFFLNGDILLNGSWVDGTLKLSLRRSVVVQGERHQRRLAIRTEDTRHVSKLCVKALLISENFHS